MTELCIDCKEKEAYSEMQRCVDCATKNYLDICAEVVMKLPSKDAVLILLSNVHRQGYFAGKNSRDDVCIRCKKNVAVFMVCEKCDFMWLP